MNYGRRVYVPSLSSISPNRLSGTRICEDVRWEFWLIWTLILKLLEKRYLFCSSNFVVPSIVSCLLFAFHPQCMSLSDLSYLKFCYRYPEKLLLPSLSPFFKNLPSHQIPPVFPFGVQRMGRKESAWKISSFQKGKKDKKVPLFFTGRVWLGSGAMRCQGVTLFPFGACSPPALVHSHWSWFLKIASSICLQRRIISCWSCFPCAGFQRWKQTRRLLTSYSCTGLGV